MHGSSPFSNPAGASSGFSSDVFSERIYMQDDYRLSSYNDHSYRSSFRAVIISKSSIIYFSIASPDIRCMKNAYYNNSK